MEPPWNVKDVALFLGVPRSWVYSATEHGILPHLRIGRYLKFEPDRVNGQFTVTKIEKAK